MFGYLDIQKDTLNDGQRGLWQTFMCGLCFSTKKLVGNIPRMTITNDINCFNILFHSILNVDINIEHKRCFSSPFKKRTVIEMTELTDKLSLANVLLTYWNIHDDVVDGDKGKKFVEGIYKKYHKKAQPQVRELDDTIAMRYNQLRELEKGDCDSIDIVSDSFAMLSQDFCKIILGENTNDYAETLCYNLGKWIYLIDALDDAKKDLKRGNYNPFVKCYNAQNIADLATHKQEIQFVMYTALNRIAQSYNDLNLTKYTCLLKNIFFESIRNKTKDVLQNLVS
jgi:hypothetical protein